MFPLWLAPALTSEGLAFEIEPAAYGAWIELQGSSALPEGGIQDVVVPIRLGDFLSERVETPVFVDSNGTTVLPHELEVTDEDEVYWVRVRELAPGVPIGVYWDGPASPLLPARVWDDTLAVWHFTGSTQCSVCDSISLGTPGYPGPAPGLWGEALDANTIYGGLELLDGVTSPMTVSAWMRLGPGATEERLFVVGLGTAEVKWCSDRAVQLIVSPEASECLHLEPDAWNFFALTLTGAGYRLTVNDQEASLSGSVDAIGQMGVGPHLDAHIDELRVYDGERDPFLLHFDWRSAYDPLFVPVYDQETVTVTDPGTDPGQLLPDEETWGAARWSGGCAVGGLPGSTGAMALLALLCARRSRP